MTSLEFTGTGTCTDCGATWKLFSTGPYRINRGGLVSTGPVLTLTQGGCDHPAPLIALTPDPASRDRINAARAKRGWPPIDDPTTGGAPAMNPAPGVNAPTRCAKEARDPSQSGEAHLRPAPSPTRHQTEETPTMTTAPDDVWAATAGGNTTINRDRWGRPLIIPPGGGKPIPYTRCTTYVGSVDDLYGLMGWKQRQTAVGLAARRDLHLRAASLGPQPADPVAARTWKAQMDDVCEQAMEAAGSSEKATIGTALHTFTEGIDRGLPVTPPADYAPHLDAYRAATAGWGMEHVEAFVVLDDLLIGGTADRIVTIPGERGRFIADVKTGSIDYPHKMAMQLAVYSRSLLYDTATGTRTPVDGLRTDAGIIIHLDAATGRCSLHWADLDAGWEAVQLATQVRAWRKRRDILAQDPAPAPTPATVARMPKSAASVAVSVAIGCAATVDQLITLRQATGDGWTDEHTAQLRARLVHITQTPGA